MDSSSRSSGAPGVHPYFASPITSVGQGSSVSSQRQDGSISRGSPANMVVTHHSPVPSTMIYVHHGYVQDDRPPRHVTPSVTSSHIGYTNPAWVSPAGAHRHELPSLLMPTLIHNGHPYVHQWQTPSPPTNLSVNSREHTLDVRQYVRHPYPVESNYVLGGQVHPNITSRTISPNDIQHSDVGADEYSISATTIQSVPNLSSDHHLCNGNRTPSVHPSFRGSHIGSPEHPAGSHSGSFHPANVHAPHGSHTRGSRHASSVHPSFHGSIVGSTPGGHAPSIHPPDSLTVFTILTLGTCITIILF